MEEFGRAFCKTVVRGVSSIDGEGVEGCIVRTISWVDDQHGWLAAIFSTTPVASQASAINIRKQNSERERHGRIEFDGGRGR